MANFNKKSICNKCMCKHCFNDICPVQMFSCKQFCLGEPVKECPDFKEPDISEVSE